MNYLNAIYKNTCFVCVKEKSPQDVSFIPTKCMFDRGKNANHIWRLYIHMSTSLYFGTSILRECSGSVVECLTLDRRAAESSLTGVTALWSLSKTHLS